MKRIPAGSSRAAATARARRSRGSSADAARRRRGEGIGRRWPPAVAAPQRRAQARRAERRTAAAGIAGRAPPPRRGRHVALLLRAPPLLARRPHERAAGMGRPRPSLRRRIPRRKQLRPGRTASPPSGVLHHRRRRVGLQASGWRACRGGGRRATPARGRCRRPTRQAGQSVGAGAGAASSAAAWRRRLVGAGGSRRRRAPLLQEEQRAGALALARSPGGASAQRAARCTHSRTRRTQIAAAAALRHCAAVHVQLGAHAAPRRAPAPDERQVGRPAGPLEGPPARTASAASRKSLHGGAEEPRGDRQQVSRMRSRVSR